MSSSADNQPTVPPHIPTSLLSPLAAYSQPQGLGFVLSPKGKRVQANRKKGPQAF